MTSKEPVDVRAAVCCGCSQQCGVRITARNGKIAKIEGDPDHPVSAGYLCTKGAHAHKVATAPSRLRMPLRRVGHRGSGQWRAISWDRALDEIAERIGDISAKCGPESVAYSFGTLHAADWGIGERFMNILGSPNTVGQDKVCYGPNALAEVLTYGWGPSMYTWPTVGLTRTQVLWGCRPRSSMPLLWRATRRTQKAGGALIVVDPVRTVEATRADLWLQVRPGTDIELALGMLNTIIAEGLYDKDFVSTTTFGFEELAAHVEAYPPERVSHVTGVSSKYIRDAARLIAVNTPALVHGSNGLCQVGSSALQAGRALACIIAVTGNLNRAGAHILAGPPAQLIANGEAVLCAELTPQQRAKRLGASKYPFIGDGYAEVDEVVAQAWYGKHHTLSWMATAHEPSLWDAILEGRPYQIRGLILQAHNAVGSAANAGRALAALKCEDLELLVAHDLFLNATTMLADYLLPAAHWLEKPFYSAGYGYVGFSGEYAEAKPAFLAPSPQARSDYELFRDLGRRLGQGSRWPETAEMFWSSLLAPTGASFNAVTSSIGPITGSAEAALSEPRDGLREYGTATGKVELFSTVLAGWGLSPLPDHQSCAENSESYPYLLITGGRELAGFHQMAQQSGEYRSRRPHPVVTLHPETAERIKVRDGDWVVVKTEIGQVSQQVRLDDALPEDVVHADRWWYPENYTRGEDPFGAAATNINFCTSDSRENCDPALGSWQLRGLPCQIQRDERHLSSVNSAAANHPQDNGGRMRSAKVQ